MLLAACRPHAEIADGSIDRRDDGQRPRFACVVRSIHDGDTMRCVDDRRVRLLLIDAPEIGQRPFGVKARDALRSMVTAGDTVWLELDVQPTDRYQRTLAYVWTEPRGGTLLNREMARLGFAVALVYPPNVRYVDEIRAAVVEARAARSGLWAENAFACSPLDHRRGHC